MLWSSWNGDIWWPRWHMDIYIYIHMIYIYHVYIYIYVMYIYIYDMYIFIYDIYVYDMYIYIWYMKAWRVVSLSLPGHFLWEGSGSTSPDGSGCLVSGLGLCGLAAGMGWWRLMLNLSWDLGIWDFAFLWSGWKLGGVSSCVSKTWMGDAVDTCSSPQADPISAQPCHFPAQSPTTWYRPREPAGKPSQRDGSLVSSKASQCGMILEFWAVNLVMSSGPQVMKRFNTFHPGQRLFLLFGWNWNMSSGTRSADRPIPRVDPGAVESPKSPNRSKAMQVEPALRCEIPGVASLPLLVLRKKRS